MVYSIKKANNIGVTGKNNNKTFLNKGGVVDRKIKSSFERIIINDVESLDLDIKNDYKLLINCLESFVRYKTFSVSDVNMDDNFDYLHYQELFDKYMDLYKNGSKREKSVMAAMFLATQLPKLPYFHGGGHELSMDKFIGLNPNWGKNATIKFGSDNQKEGEVYPYFYDCSGFVTWAMCNGGYKFNVNDCPNALDLSNLGEKKELKNIDLSAVQVGDLAWRKGHVGMIVDVSKTNHEIKVAHTSYSGEGMNITTINTDTGRIVYDSVGSSNVDRIGDEYFTHITLMDYGE